MRVEELDTTDDELLERLAVLSHAPPRPHTRRDGCRPSTMLEKRGVTPDAEGPGMPTIHLAKRVSTEGFPTARVGGP